MLRFDQWGGEYVEDSDDLDDENEGYDLDEDSYDSEDIVVDHVMERYALWFNEI